MLLAVIFIYICLMATSAALVGIALRYWFEDLKYCLQTKDYGGAVADIGLCICLIALGILLALIWTILIYGMIYK